MFKTCIIVPRVGQVPDTINHILDDIGWHVDTIIFEPDQVSFYVRYKWYQYYKVCALKKAVKNYAKESHIMIAPLSLDIYLRKRQDHLPTNSKKRSQSFPTQQQFKEVLDAEMSKL